jgi:DNA replication protein DnaC
VEFIEYQGKKKFGQAFKIHQSDLNVIHKLLVYAIKDEKSAAALNIDLSKGILLSGKNGCGKTSIMHLLKPFMPSKFDYKIKTCREVSFEFIKNGFEALQPYTQKTYKQTRLPGFCFDDFGAEQQIKHFGNDCNVMAEIIISRYEPFIETKTVTHLTTNLSATEIEKLYDSTLSSRMKQMFNLISFNSDTIDKR